MAKSRLHELTEHGVSVWIDTLSRELLETGELARLMKEDAVVGVTSNPTIFEKALSAGDWYDDQLREILGDEDKDPKEIFVDLAIEDVRRGCDLLRPVWEDTGRRDGYVSLEVDPGLAYDREGSYEEAMRFHELVDRPNLFVKIPGTEPGLGAIEDCIAAGRSINITLIFSLERHSKVIEAYIRGLERLVAGGGDPAPVASVASFFVSRVDTEADRRLGRARARGSPGEARDSEREAGVPAVPEGVLRRSLGGACSGGSDSAALPVGVDVDQEPGLPRRLVRRGADRAAHRQHDAAGDGGRIPGSRCRARHVDRGRGRGAGAPRGVAEAGVDYDDVVEALEREGVEKFSDSLRQVLEGIDAKRAALVCGCDATRGVRSQRLPASLEHVHLPAAAPSRRRGRSARPARRSPSSSSTSHPHRVRRVPRPAWGQVALARGGVAREPGRPSAAVDSRPTPGCPG